MKFNSYIIAWQPKNPNTKYQRVSNTDERAKIYRCGNCNKFVSLKSMYKMTKYDKKYGCIRTCPHCIKEL